MSQAALAPSPSDAAAPIGVFDSGIGGLSVLRALRAQLPHESFVYFADSAHAPYGEKGEDFVLQRSLSIAQTLIQQHRIKALVVACNTATAAAVRTLRGLYPQLPLVGIEPAIKPAAHSTQTGRVGVVATRGTIESEKLKRLIALHGGQAQFICQPCPGLAKAIEELPETQDLSCVRSLIKQYLSAMGQFGQGAGQIDTLVLGCTHYPLVASEFTAALPPGVQILETGAAVARRCAQLLAEHTLLRPPQAATQLAPLKLLTSAQPEHMARASAYWQIS